LGTPHHSTKITRFVNRFFQGTIPHTPSLQLTNIYEIKHIITSLKPRTAPGDDGITPPMLRNLSRKALINLTQLFNQLLWLGHFSTTSKTAKVIPIPKPNKPSSDPNSYRQISLLSTLGKLFERIIAARLTSLSINIISFLIPNLDSEKSTRQSPN